MYAPPSSVQIEQQNSVPPVAPQAEPSTIDTNLRSQIPRTPLDEWMSWQPPIAPSAPQTYTAQTAPQMVQAALYQNQPVFEHASAQGNSTYQPQSGTQQPAVQLPPSRPPQVPAQRTYSFIAVDPTAAPGRRSGTSAGRRARAATPSQAPVACTPSTALSGLASASGPPNVATVSGLGPPQVATTPQSSHSYQRPKTPPAYVPPPELPRQHSVQPVPHTHTVNAQHHAEFSHHASVGQSTTPAATMDNTTVRENIARLVDNLASEEDRRAILSILSRGNHPSYQSAPSGSKAPQEHPTEAPNQHHDISPLVMFMDKFQHVENVFSQHAKQAQGFQYVVRLYLPTVW